MAPKKPGKCWDGSASGMKWPHTRRSRSRNCSCSGAGREQSEVFGDFFDEGFQEGGLDEPYFLQEQFFLDGGHAVRAHETPCFQFPMEVFRRQLKAILGKRRLRGNGAGEKGGVRFVERFVGNDDGGPNLVINEVRVGVTDQNNVALLHAITSSIFPTGLRARLPKLC